MKKKRWAVISGFFLSVCVLVLPLNAMTAAAEAYEDIQMESPEAEITIGVSGFVQLPAAAAPESPGTEEPEPEVPGEDENTAVVTPVTTMKTAAPQTGDDGHSGGRYIIQFILAGIAVALMISQGKDKGTRNIGNLKNTL